MPAVTVLRDGCETPPVSDPDGWTPPASCAVAAVLSTEQYRPASAGFDMLAWLAAAGLPATLAKTLKQHGVVEHRHLLKLREEAACRMAPQPGTRSRLLRALRNLRQRHGTAEVRQRSPRPPFVAGVGPSSPAERRGAASSPRRSTPARQARSGVPSLDLDYLRRRATEEDARRVLRDDTARAERERMIATLGRCPPRIDADAGDRRRDDARLREQLRRGGTTSARERQAFRSLTPPHRTDSHRRAAPTWFRPPSAAGSPRKQRCTTPQPSPCRLNRDPGPPYRADRDPVPPGGDDPAEADAAVYSHLQSSYESLRDVAGPSEDRRGTQRRRVWTRDGSPLLQGPARPTVPAAAQPAAPAAAQPPYTLAEHLTPSRHSLRHSPSRPRRYAPAPRRQSGQQVVWKRGGQDAKDRVRS